MHRAAGLIVVCFLLAAMGCAGKPSVAPTTTQFAGLPALSSLRGSPAAPRTASEIQTRSGEQTFRSGGNIDNSSGKPDLTPGAKQLSYCIYQFDTASTDTPSQLSFALSKISASAQMWIAISDYRANRWSFYFVPQAASGGFSLSAPAGAYSSGAHTYVAFVAWDQSDFELDSVSLTVSPLTTPVSTWMHQLGTAFDGNEEFYTCALDGAGKLWVAGIDPRTGNFDENLLVARYAANGTLDYQRTWVHTPSGGSGALAISPLDGSVYLGGGLEPVDPFTPSYGDPSVLLLKLDNTGALLWSKAATIPLARGSVHSLTVNSDGSIYAIGSWGNDMTQVHNGFVARYAADGSLVWVRRWAETPDPGGFLADGPTGVAIVGGALYIAATYLDASNSLNDGVLLKFTLNGALVWAKQWDCDSLAAGDTGYRISPALAPDGAGGVVWCGLRISGASPGPYTHYVSLLHFQPDGTVSQQYGYQLATPSQLIIGYTGGVSLAVDSSGNQFVRLGTEIDTNSTEHVLAGFDAAGDLVSDGQLVDSTGAPGPRNLAAITAGGPGEVYAVGNGGVTTGAHWVPAGGTAFAPAVVPQDYALGDVDDFANWTITDKSGTFGDPGYVVDREADRDALALRLQFP